MDQGKFRIKNNQLQIEIDGQWYAQQINVSARVDQKKCMMQGKDIVVPAHAIHVQTQFSWWPTYTK